MSKERKARIGDQIIVRRPKNPGVAYAEGEEPEGIDVFGYVTALETADGLDPIPDADGEVVMATLIPPYGPIEVGLAFERDDSGERLHGWRFRD